MAAALVVGDCIERPLGCRAMQSFDSRDGHRPSPIPFPGQPARHADVPGMRPWPPLLVNLYHLFAIRSTSFYKCTHPSLRAPRAWAFLGVRQPREDSGSVPSTCPRIAINTGDRHQQQPVEPDADVVRPGPTDTALSGEAGEAQLPVLPFSARWPCRLSCQRCGLR
jgi:hypothetical protein